MFNLSLIAWVIAICVMLYQTIHDFKTGMLNRRATHIGIAATGVILAGIKSVAEFNAGPVVLSLITGITAYYFFKYMIYRTGLIGGGDVRVMYSLGFMFPSLADVPVLINNSYMFGARETWPYLSMYFNLVIIAAFFLIFETLFDCWKAGLISRKNKNYKYFVISFLFFALMAAFTGLPSGFIRALAIILSFALGLTFLKKFSRDIIRKKVKLQDLPALNHPIIPTQYIIEDSGAIKVIDTSELKKLKKEKKKFRVVSEKNSVIPWDILHKLASLAPSMELEIKVTKPRTVYLLIMVILLPLGDLFTVINRVIIG
jgi:Flp pilus assembly protein protease CpaA